MSIFGTGTPEPYSPEMIERRRTIARSEFDKGTDDQRTRLKESFVMSGRGGAGGQLLQAQKDQESEIADRWTEISGGIDQEASFAQQEERNRDMEKRFLREERLGRESFATKERLSEEDFRTRAAQKEYEYERSMLELRSSLAEQLARSEASMRRKDLMDTMMGEAAGNIIGSWMSRPSPSKKA